MKARNIYLLIATLSILLFSCKTNTSNLEKSENSLEILLIGTFHFANFNPSLIQDIAETKEVDVLTDKNQKELQLITEAIVEFNPSKIFVEYPHQKQSRLDSLFQSFSTENYQKEKRSEIIQLAYRVGKRLGLETLYGIDHRTNFPYQALQESMERAGQEQLLKKEEEELLKYESAYNSIVTENQSLMDVLLFLNSEDERKNDLAWYLNDANRAGTFNDTIGVYLVSEYYKRNLLMYSSIQKRITQEDNRIMILVGASHAAIFESFIQYNPNWNTLELGDLVKTKNPNP